MKLHTTHQSDRPRCSTLEIKIKINVNHQLYQRRQRRMNWNLAIDIDIGQSRILIGRNYNLIIIEK